MATPVHLLGCDLPGLEDFFGEIGERPFRAHQLMQWVYKRGVLDPGAMTSLSKELRAKLCGAVTLDLPRVEAEQQSDDGTRKLLLRLGDGEKVEAVLIPEQDRLTLCVSCQVGCAMACGFCRTGAVGLRRNLAAHEIVGQVLLAQQLAGTDRGVTNVVFMGMGEPLDNLDNVLRAFRILTSDHGLNITKRRLTVSTCGLVDAMKRLPPDVLLSLAISLNATTDEIRDRIMPVNRRYPIRQLLDALRALPMPPRARFTIEYVLLDGVNDSLADAQRLVKLLSDVRCKVNLISYNPHPGSPFEAPRPAAVHAFQSYLIEKNLTAIVRKSRGQDIHAACGQLSGQVTQAPATGATV